MKDKKHQSFADFVLKEWLLVTSGAGLVLTSLYISHIPEYTIKEFKILLLLFVLFIVVKGLIKSGIISKIALKVEKGHFIALTLILLTFFLSMLITNDIALLVVVPLTLSLNVNRKGILVILEALSANAGSALTPMGNPQNLFIYLYYNVSPYSFINAIVPFSLILLIFLVITALFIKVQNLFILDKKDNDIKTDKKALIYGVLFIFVLLSVFNIIPVESTIIVIVYVLIFDRASLNIDYSLLFSFLFFFGIANNLKVIIGPKIIHSKHIFILSALASQLMSNVPATLLFARFTSKWQALLWGANAGGFGSLFGSLANLIAYKLYITDKNTNDSFMFTIQFLIMGYTALFISIGLYFLLYGPAT